MSVQIFINYRVEDTGGYAWAVNYRLAQRFGAENVFFDNIARGSWSVTGR